MTNYRIIRKEGVICTNSLWLYMYTYTYYAIHNTFEVITYKRNRHG